MATARHRDTIARRMEGNAVLLGADKGAFTECPYGTFRRWRVDERWIEFECGCVAERTPRLFAKAKSWEPVIFQGLPELAVYERCCDKHRARMDFRVGFGGFATFAQWYRARRHLLLGRAAA